MTMLTVSAEGQVTLHDDLLQHLGVEPGQRLAVELLPGGRLTVHAEPFERSISDIFGILKRPGQRCLTIEEINEAAARGWAGER